MDYRSVLSSFVISANCARCLRFSDVALSHFHSRIFLSIQSTAFKSIKNCLHHVSSYYHATSLCPSTPVSVTPLDFRFSTFSIIPCCLLPIVHCTFPNNLLHHQLRYYVQCVQFHRLTLRSFTLLVRFSRPSGFVFSLQFTTYNCLCLWQPASFARAPVHFSSALLASSFPKFLSRMSALLCLC